VETAPGTFLLGTSWLVIFPNDKHDQNNKGNCGRTPGRVGFQKLGNFTSVIIGASIQQSTMPAYYKIDKERRLVMTTCGGVFTFADALMHQENLLKDSDFDPSFSQLVDLTQVTTLDIEAEEMRRFAQRSVFSPDSRRALLANTDHVFGMGRMFEILRENFGERGIRVFRNLDDALEWVLAKNTAA
jgi:hypothetical protein